MRTRTAEHLRPLLREVVLSLGGVLATHTVADEVVRDIVRAIGWVVDRRLDGGGIAAAASDPTKAPAPTRRAHPAIIDLLARLESGAAEPEESEWLRLPGLYRRWELEQVMEVDQEFLIEAEGNDQQGTSLFAVYSRPRTGEEVAS